MNCDYCLNSRPVISENGLHYICCLSSKKAVECQINNRFYQSRYYLCRSQDKQEEDKDLCLRIESMKS